MTAEQKKAYALGDNKLDIGITGFSIAEIDNLIEGLSQEEAGDPEDDRLPDLQDANVVSRPGDIWELGPHRVLCGNCLDRTAYERLLGRERAQMVFTDPPYNVPIAGHVGGLGRIKHRDFAMASGEMSGDEFTLFLTTAFENLAAFSIDGSVHFVCMDWRHMPEMLAAVNENFRCPNSCARCRADGGPNGPVGTC